MGLALVSENDYGTTVSAHIERHSWLACQEAHFGYTVNIFYNFLSENSAFSEKLDKNDRFEQPENYDF